MLTKAAIKYLHVVPASNHSITIKESLTYECNVLRNRTWYRGDSSELDQFFKQTTNDAVSKSRFWAAVPSDNLDIRKIHSGLPSIICDTLADIVVSDLDDIDLGSDVLNGMWDEIATDNDFTDLLNTAVVDTLVTGDGAFKLSMDTDITAYPIIEFFSGDRVSYNYKRGRLQEIIFYTEYLENNKTYKLEETYGKGYINYSLLDENGKKVPMNLVADVAELQNLTFNGDFIMAVPIKFFRSAKFKDRGKSIFDSKSDSFDALDEVLSQWIDAIRDGRVNKYIPESLLPRNPETGEILKPNSFDNRFIATGNDMNENAKNEISLQQADINYDAFTQSYASALDVCLQGIISPSTLGIDLKKTDNAESQREKEKTTLYTRGKIVDKLTDVIPLLVAISLKVNDLTTKKTAGDYEASIEFGEYASPSFDNIVETVGQAKSYGVMSIEQCINEMYGDTWTDEQKADEIQRIKEQNGMLEADEPKVIDDYDQLDNSGDENAEEEL
ncbi:capsid protein [Clostridium sp. BJN0001]|uniref:capsid protein n=1 Tax=Clostridium sp. BJN0001 TaxID=2930219 RepID=UPI001FD1D2AA|nr:capsid protein [Clostridium sp. BJN0001]